MRPFNLAEAKIVERTYCKEQLSRRLRIIALLAILTLGAFAVSYGCKVSVQGKATRFKSELADVQGRCIAIKNEIAAIKAKSSQRKWQGQLANSSKRWLGILGAVVSRVPDDVWLNRLESSESNSSVSIEGQAVSFAALSGFIGSIRSSPKFADVRINSARVGSASTSPDANGGEIQPTSPSAREGQAGVTIVDFSLQIKLRSTGGPASNTAAPQAQAVPPVQESP